MPSDDALDAVSSLIDRSKDQVAAVRDYIEVMNGRGYTREQAVQILQREVSRGHLAYTSQFDIRQPA